MFGTKLDLIVTIVNKGMGENVIAAAKNAGACGATLIKGHGSDLADMVMLFEVPIEPEKDIVLCVVPERISSDVMSNISLAASLEKKGAGISFILPIKDSIGVIRQGIPRSVMD